MKAYAFIPARGGSKRVPGKNLREVGGMSLLNRAITAAQSALRDQWDADSGALYAAHLNGGPYSEPSPIVYVSTDDDDIAAATREYCKCGRAKCAEQPIGCYFRNEDGELYEDDQPRRIAVHTRPPQLATDHAQIESALQHWWTRLDDKPDAIVLLQPTSPFRTAAHVREALRLLEATGADSVVGVTVGHEHHFAGRLKPREGLIGPFGDVGAPFAPGAFYDFAPFRVVTADRPRTQDLRPMGAENGALYAFTRAHWERTGNRMGGHMVALPMTRWEGLDVDDETDLAVANALVAGGVCK